MRGVWITALIGWLLLVCLPAIALLDGAYIGFEVATIRCGHQPAIATEFAAGYTYELPGDPGYGPSLFEATFFCSAGEAEAAGYHRI